MKEENNKQENPTVARLLNLRKRLAITQKEMAVLFGIHLRTWQDWEFGTNQPTGTAMVLLSVYEANPPFVPSFAEQCNQLRKLLGMTRKEMAKKFGCSSGTWGSWESGKKRSHPDTRKKIEEMLREHVNSCVITKPQQPRRKTKIAYSQDHHEKTILTKLLEQERTQAPDLRTKIQFRKSTFHKTITGLLQKELIIKHKLGRIIEYELTEKGKLCIGNTNEKGLSLIDTNAQLFERKPKTETSTQLIS